MSATIYIKSNGDDDLTSEQLELLHRYSDQARVWSYLLLIEAGLIKSPEEWRQRREEWLKIRQELETLSPDYASAVVKALQQQYQDEKVIAETPIPSAQDFLKDAPEKVKQAQDLADRIKQNFIDLYPSRKEIGHSGPFLSEQERADLLSPPDITDLSEEEAKKKIEEWQEKAGLSLEKWNQSGVSPVLDMVKGFTTNHGTQIVDPETGAIVYDPATKAFNEDLMEDFASDVLVRAIKSYNPFKSEDTGIGYGGKKASFGTYLYRVMINEIKSRKDKYARNQGRKDVLPDDATISDIVNRLTHQMDVNELKKKVEEEGLTPSSSPDEWRAFYEKQQSSGFKINRVPYSLSQPMSGEDDMHTLEETIAEKGSEEGIPWENYIEPLREKLYERVNAPGSKFSAESAERMVDIYERIFSRKQRMTEVARDLGFITDRPRDKELSLMKQLGIDISQFPARIPPERSSVQDRLDRQKILTKFFADLLKKIETLRSQEQTPDVVKELKASLELLKNAKDKLDAATRPNTGRIHNLFWGDPRAANKNVPAIISILMELDPEIKKLVEEASRSRKRTTLEEFLTSISQLRTEGSLNYNLLRNKIQQKLSRENPQLFTVYTYLYEDSYSNPDTARMMRLSPPRITGLKKKIISTLLDLPEIQSFLYSSELDTLSPLRRFIYKEGDIVKVISINEIGTIETTTVDNWYRIRLHNGNEVLTVKEDIQKHSTLVDSAQNVLTHYFSRSVITPQCYLSFIAAPRPQLVILELRPSSEITTTARLHVNDNLIEIVEFKQKYPDNLISVLKGHIGVSTSIDTPFTPLFEEVQ